MILVVGATGVLGTEICRRLRAEGQAVRGLVRAGSARAHQLRDLGVELVEGDMRTRASLDAACRGASAAISTATAMGSADRSLTLRSIDHDAQLSLVAAAVSAGVKTFVFISASPNLTDAAPLIRYKRAVERAVRASGMRWTVLQPSCFMEIWLSGKLGWDFARAKVNTFGAGTAPVSWISVSDVAEHAVRALDDERMANRDVPLGGPAALPPNDVVAVFERASGRRYTVKHIPRPLLATMAPVVALFSEGIGSGMSLGAQSARGDVIDSPLQREVGIPLTSVSEYAERVIAAQSPRGG